MQNLYLLYPGTVHSWTGGPPFPIGSPIETYDRAKRWIMRSQSGYTGPKPKKLGVNPYSFTYLDLSAEFEALKHNDFYHRVDPWLTYGDDLNNSVIAFEFHGLPSTNNLYNRLLDKFSERVRGSLDLSIDLAEAGKTVKMLNLRDQVVETAKTWRRRFPQTKTVANIWLTYTYGVRPLLSSIYGAADESIRTVINRSSRFSAKVTEQAPITGIGIYGTGPSHIPFDSTIKRSYNMGIDLETPAFDPSRWSSLNPVSIAWELLPYSFVADWFVNVGGYLRNMETAIVNGNRFKGGYLTYLEAADLSWNVDVNKSDPGYPVFKRGRLKYRSINRDILTQYPSPRYPSFKADLGSSRMISAAALLAQFLGGKPATTNIRSRYF